MTKSKVDPLLQAVLREDVKSVENAIESGADINSRDRDKRTPLFHAVIDGQLEIASKLLEEGADPNIHDKNGEPPLHFAARESRVDLAELLLKSGAEVDSQDLDGNTPLGRAVFVSEGGGEMIRVLLRHGADKHLKNEHGVSPEDLADSIANYDLKSFLQ